MSQVLNRGFFNNNAANFDIVRDARFRGFSVNVGTVLDYVTFLSGSTNVGRISGSAIFKDFTENSGGGHIEEYAVFAGNSVNYGTVKTAVFLESAINQGTILLSATFAGNSANGKQGTVAVSAIFTETAANSGSVTGQALFGLSAVNTGTFSVSSSYEQETNGFYSYGYYIDSVKIAPEDYNIQVYQVGDKWYKYDQNGVGIVAEGMFNNGSGQFNLYKHGEVKTFPTYIFKENKYSIGYYDDNYLVTNYNSPNGVPEKAVDTFLFYTYLSGAATVADGAFSDRFYVNGSKSFTYTKTDVPLKAKDNNLFYTFINGTPSPGAGSYTFGNIVNGALSNTIITPVTALDADTKWFVYTNGVSISATGAFSNGYFLSATKTGTFVRPQTARDNSDYYLYADGIPTAAFGAYTNGFFNPRGKMTVLEILTPAQAQDRNTPAWYVYSSTGVPQSADGPYSNGFYDNGVIDSAYSSLSGTPEDIAIDDSLFYIYTNGVSTPADGFYSNGYFVGAEKQLVTISIPRQAVDNPPYYYVYTNGVASLADGVFQNGYFTNGIRSTYTNNTPTLLDGSWKVFNNGVAILANGAYTNGYFEEGTKSEVYTSPNNLPQTVLNSNLKYIIINGTSSLAEGGYTTGYFVSGALSAANISIPLTAQNIPSLWYVYTNGTPLTASGGYSFGYFTFGSRTGTTITPVSAKDNSSLWYLYTAGDPLTAQGAYSSGYFVFGSLSGTFTQQQSAKDNDLYYAYTDGRPVQAVGTYWYSTASDNWYLLSSWFEDKSLTIKANILPRSNTEVIILSTSTATPFVNIDDSRWVQPFSIDAREIGITFYSTMEGTITCNLSGAPITYEGNSNFR